MALNSLKLIILFLMLCFVLGIIQLFVNKFNKSIFSKMQMLCILIFSYGFMAYANIRFALCIFIVTVFTYLCALQIQKKNQLYSKKKLTISISLLILMLGYFKYTNFFLSGITKVLGLDSVTLKIILPLGISFYIFTAIGYLIDIYRRDYEAETSFLNFALFIGIFTKVTAGPIVRGNVFLPQAKEYKGIHWNQFTTGMQIFVMGLFKKMVIADHLGVFVNDVYNAPGIFSTGTVILAVISYALQIYFDFSGYSDMAVGMSKALGFDLSKNFNYPYMAENPSEFWSRWHISLSSWFRDYLYIPLGGSRKGKTRTYINLMLVMLLSGLWHGAGMTFILWGALHGIASCIHKLFKDTRKKQRKGEPARENVFIKTIKIVAMAITAALFWVPFRAESLANTMEIYKAMFTIHDGIVQPYTWSFFAIICLVIATIAASYKCKKKAIKKIDGTYPVVDLTTVAGLTVFFVVIGLTIMMGYYGNTAFIYGNF